MKSVNKNLLNSIHLLFKFSAMTEILGGIVVLAMPVKFVTLLFGQVIGFGGINITRLFALAIISLGIAAWESSSDAPMSSPRKALCIYNIAVGILLISIGATQEITGILLWPGVLFHLVLGLPMLAGLRYQ